MQIISFPSHYQLVYISFDISSFSVISYMSISFILLGNRYAFCTQYICYYARKPIYIKN